MALNYIWIAFFLIAFAIALVKVSFLGDTEAFKLLIDGSWEAAKSAGRDIALRLSAPRAVWLGIMKLA